MYAVAELMNDMNSGVLCWLKLELDIQREDKIKTYRFCGIARLDGAGRFSSSFPRNTGDL